MPYYVTIAPDLGITPEDFISSWGDLAQCRKVADADFPPEQNSKNFDPTLAQASLLTLSGLSLNIGSSALYDLIKEALYVKLNRRQRLKMVELNRPDNKRVIVVTADEG